jgi:HEPN domain-containing protein
MTINMPKEWLKASTDDLKVISRIIEMEDLSHIIAFHAQQSIEKSFKALLEYKNIKVPKQHDLLKLKFLINQTFEIESDDLLDTLNELYIDSRYPSDMGLLPNGKPTLEEAKEFYEFAQNIFDRVCTQLNTNKEDIKCASSKERR